MRSVGPSGSRGRGGPCLQVLQYADKMYGIKSQEDCDASDGGDEDIESAIQKELGALKDKGKRSSDQALAEVRIKEECLLFMRCRPPIEPVEFSRRICQDAASTGHGAKARYLNRLTPLTAIAKASETGLDEAARKALAGHFKLKSAGTEEHSKPPAIGTQSESQDDGADQEAKPATVRSRVSAVHIPADHWARSTPSGRPSAVTTPSRGTM